MPIRINFLAAQLEQEAQRRRDPVKRGYLVGGLLVGIVLFVFLFLQIKLWRMREEQSLVDNKFDAIKQRYELALTNAARLQVGEQRLAALDALSRERLLVGNVLNAMQHVTMPQVSLTELRIGFNYKLTEAVKKTDTKPGAPAKVTETITMTLDARETAAAGGPAPGDLIESYREKLGSQPYFSTNMWALRMAGRSPVAVDAVSGDRYVSFKLEYDFKVKERLAP